MRYIEKETPKGFILRVNRIKGNFSIFKDHKLIPNPSSEYNSVRYQLQRVIFVGDIFRKDFIGELDIGFFYVSRRQVIIPFRVFNMSDVRHIKLPGYIDCDMLPVSIYYFNDLSIRMYSNALKTGIPYFVLESKASRSYIAYLRQKFPLSRVIIYKPNQTSFNPEEASIIEKYNRSLVDFDAELIDETKQAI